MNTIMNAYESVKSAVTEALSTNVQHDNLSDILALEEQERAYRIEHAAQSAIARGNANNVSKLVSSLQFPYFKGGLNKGFKAYTRKIEELERQRLLAAKADLALTKHNARMVAGHINSLGWPFLENSGPKFILTDAFKLAEEEERERRLADKNWMMHARNNAALVSNLIRWDNYQRHTSAGLKRMTRNLEEKERVSRLTDKADQERAADLAFQTSGLIRRLGWPFYVQPVLDNKEYTRAIEEAEKDRRLVNPHERLMAKENASQIANLLHAKDAAFLEEKEKERRLEDTLEQERHKSHAKKVAGIIAFTNAPSELERKRLLADKAHSREAQLGAKKVAEIVPHFMSLSSWSLGRAVEKERARRSNDITSIAFAKFNAKKVSQLILDADLAKKTAWTNELEQERMRRMHDRLASDLSKKNARKVSNMILNKNNNSLSATEAERARRLADTTEQQRHRDVAKTISGLVLAKPVLNNSTPLDRSVDVELGLPTATASRSAPTLIEPVAAPIAPLASAAPIPSAPALSAPLEKSIPLQQQAPLSGERGLPLEAVQQQAPLFNQPLQQQAPLSSGLPLNQQQAPLLQQPYMGQQLPLQQQPFLGQQLPLQQQPFLGQQAPMMNTYSSPSGLPMTYGSSPSNIVPIGTTYSTSPSALPMTYRSSPVIPAPAMTSMPGAYTPTYLPGTSPAYVPYDPSVPSHMRVMTDKERRKLEKQASKHSRSSQRDARRAEHHLAKAEKLHFKGKDNRALKHETKAEQHNVAAKHHQAWAQELAADSLSHTLPSALPTVYRPAM